MEGWIKLHRKMQDWKYIKEPQVAIFFIYLLLCASNERSTQDGTELKAGQIKTNWSKLEKKLNLSQREVRTIIEKLTKTGEISVVGFERKFIIITIVNFHIYQSKKKDKKTQKNQSVNNNDTIGYDNENNTERRSAEPTIDAQKDASETPTKDSLLSSYFVENNLKDAVKDAVKDAEPENHSLYIKELKEKIEKKDKKSLSFDEKEKIEKKIVRENVALTPSQIEKVVARMGSEKNADLVFDILMAWKLKKGITLEKDREDDFGRILQWVYKQADKDIAEQKIMAKNSLKSNEEKIVLPYHKLNLELKR